MQIRNYHKLSFPNFRIEYLKKNKRLYLKINNCYDKKIRMKTTEEVLYPCSQKEFPHDRILRLLQQVPGSLESYS